MVDYDVIDRECLEALRMQCVRCGHLPGTEMSNLGGVCVPCLDYLNGDANTDGSLTLNAWRRRALEVGNV